jgi:hypothetical protein
MPVNFIDEEFADQSTLKCPICGVVYNHVARVFTLLGVDEHEAKVYEGTVATGVVRDERRSCLVVRLDCEQRHAWELRLQQHKGNIFVTAQEAKK